MYQYVKSLLKFDIFNKGKKQIINDFNKILSNSSYSDIEKMCQDKTIARIIIENDLFWNNINLIVKKFESNNIINCIKFLYNYNKNYILKNKTRLFDVYPLIAKDYIKFLCSINVDTDEIIKYLKEKNIVVDYNNIVELLINNKNLIINNLDYFIDNNHKLLELKEILDTNLITSNIDDVIDNNPNYVIEEMIINKTNLTIEDLKGENILNYIKEVIDSVLKYENKSYHDIKKIGAGNFSDVYKIGNKVIKIGKQRKKFNVENSKLFLQPIYRSSIKSGKDSRQLLCIEITDLIDTKNVNYENLYQVYKTLRNLGYIWVDCRMNNIGRILKDSKVSFNNKKSTEILKVGDIVILDSDYIYSEEEFSKLDKRNNEKLNNINNYNLLKNLEMRYQNEQTSSYKTI